MKYELRQSRRAETLVQVVQHLSSLDPSKDYDIEFTARSGRRTLTQSNALHLWCQMTADTLNAAGYDMKRTLKHDAEIPWTKESVKEHLWRPVQAALTEKQSTTEITTVEPTLIHETLCRHLAEKLGVECPAWPSRGAA